MTSALHVTNGSSTVESLKAGGIEGETLSWDDVLHEGPLPNPANVAGFRRIRADYLAAAAWVDGVEVLDRLERRDRRFAEAAPGGRRMLWFEHDLYDQLQILQILHRMRDEGADPADARLLCIDRHPGIDPFHGLGQLQPAQLVELRHDAVPLRQATVDAAAALWEAICEPDPDRWARMSQQPIDGLPFLRPALARWLQEFPSIDGGLSRTERQLLEALGEGPRTLQELFRAGQLVEPAPFLGDASFARIARELTAARPAPVAYSESSRRQAETTRPADAEFWERSLQITDYGRRILAGREDRICGCGIDRWIGGAHLRGAGSVWRYDGARGTLDRSDA